MQAAGWQQDLTLLGPIGVRYNGQFHAPAILTDEREAFLPLYFETRPVDLQQALSDLAQSTWGKGSFGTAVPDLEQATQDIANQTPNLVRERLLNRQNESTRLEFGPIKFSYASLTPHA